MDKRLIKIHTLDDAVQILHFFEGIVGQFAIMVAQNFIDLQLHFPLNIIVYGHLQTSETHCGRRGFKPSDEEDSSLRRYIVMR